MHSASQPILTAPPGLLNSRPDTAEHVLPGTFQPPTPSAVMIVAAACCGCASPSRKPSLIPRRRRHSGNPLLRIRSSSHFDYRYAGTMSTTGNTSGTLRMGGGRRGSSTTRYLGTWTASETTSFADTGLLCKHHPLDFDQSTAAWMCLGCCSGRLPAGQEPRDRQ